MPFTKQQQGKYRPIVERAWQTHARESGIDPKSPAARRSWYENELLAAVGLNSTVALDQGRDFDQAIAHFEAIADDGETYWQNKVESGDLRRILWTVFKKERPEIEGTRIDADYIGELASQMFRSKNPPPLRTLKKSQLTAITRALIIHRKRVEKRS